MGVKERWLAVAALAAGAAGCSDLRQSALVYSSQNNIGVVLKGGSAQAGNVDLTLGYSGHDFAIVPVAVAETCADLGKQSGCDEKNYRLVRIEGNNSIDAAAQALAALASQLSEQTRIKLLEKPPLVAQLASINSNLQVIATIPAIESQVTAKRAELAAAEARPAPNAAAESIEYLEHERAKAETVVKLKQDIATLEARISAADDLRATNTTGARDAAQTKIAEIDAFVLENERKLQKIIDRPTNSSTDLKHDALSVYGEFGGRTGAEGTKASLKVGKVFSTGVAAQNLTQQMGNVLALQQRTKCLNSALDAIKSDERLKEVDKDVLAKLYSEAIKLCGTTNQNEKI